MAKAADVSARFVAVAYTLVIAAVVWFTFAFGGLDIPGAHVDELMVFAAIALSPIPVCILCFRRG